MFFWDYTMVLLIPAIIFTMVAQARVKSAYRDYINVGNQRMMTGADAARTVLDNNGLRDVRIERVSGTLTDHYDPRTRVLRLSDAVYSTPTVGAVGIACHEAGHAIQHSRSYAPLMLRNGIVPVVNIASRASNFLLMIGIFMMFSQSMRLLGNQLFTVGVIAFSLVVLFHLITLPVEIDASRRAIKNIEEYSLVGENQQGGVKKVLRAAAMTYIAALAMSVANLLRLLLIRDRNNY